MGKSRPLGKVGNERLITGLLLTRCMFFGLIARIIILYKRKGLPEVEVAVVDKLDIYIKT